MKIERSTFFEDKAPGVKFPSTWVKAEKVQEQVENLSDLNWKKDFQLQFALKTLDCLPLKKASTGTVFEDL